MVAVARIVLRMTRAWAAITLAVTAVAVAPAAAQPGDGWFALAARPGGEWVPTDVAGLADGSLVLSYQSGRMWRYTGEGWGRIPDMRATGVVAAPGGGLLAASPQRHAVMAWRPDGAGPQPFAGGREGFAGDGGPALLAALSLTNETSSLAVLSDGSVLIPDSDNYRVRRVDPAGVITTVAGTGRAGSRGDGGPATVARLDDPVAVAALPDGGYVIAQAWGRRLRRVAPDGTISTFARPGPGDNSDVVTAPDGVFVANGGELWRIPDDGRPRRIDPVDFAGRGPGEGDGCTEAVGTDATGGLLTAGNCKSIWYRPSTTPSWPLAALRGARVNRRGIGVELESTHAGTGTVELLRRGRVIARTRRQIAVGTTTLATHARVPDGWYRLSSTVTSAAGVAHDSVWVHPVGRLRIRAARRLMSPSVEAVIEDTESFFSGRCRSFGRRRVDCEVRMTYTAWNRDRCERIASLRIRPSGIAELRTYRCGRKNPPRFQWRPRWDEPQPEVLRP